MTVNYFTLTKALKCLTFIAFITSTVHAQAENTTRHSVGLDFVRLFDNGQYEPDAGMMNLIYQGELTSRSAWQLGIAGGDEATVVDLGYKVYTTGYLKGIFMQVGLAYIDVRNSKIYDNDIAMTTQIGVEHSPAEHLTLSVGAKMTLLEESPTTGEKEPFFSPVVGLFYSF